MKRHPMRSRPARSATLLLLALALPAAACERSAAQGKLASPEAAAPPVAVKLAPAQEVRVPRLLTLSGSLIGAEEAQVAAGAAGKVLSTHVERGSVVRKGAILVRLDGRAVGAQAQAA